MPNLVAQRDHSKFYIDWWLMNHCSWACSYCHTVIRNGSFPLPDIGVCENFVDQAVAQSQSLGKRLEIFYTGGEVTEWYNLPDLLSYAHTRSVTNKIRTNLNIDLETWQDIVPYITEAKVDVHIEHSQLSHLMLLINWTLANTGCKVSVTVNMLPDRWEELNEFVDRLKGKWPKISIWKKMLFKDPIRNTLVVNYTEEQLVTFRTQKGLILGSEADKIETSYMSLILDGKNRFINHSCDIGLEQIIVTAEGVIYKGHCRQGGPLGKLGENIRWPTDPILCQKDRCANGFDICASKKIR